MVRILAVMVDHKMQVPSGVLEQEEEEEEETLNICIVV